MAPHSAGRAADGGVDASADASVEVSMKSAECEHTVLQCHHSFSDDGGPIWLGDSCIGIGRPIWSTENHAFFVGNTSDTFFFVRCPTHGLFDNDSGSELSSCLDSRSHT
jgi:hypothetical protein